MHGLRLIDYTSDNDVLNQADTISLSELADLEGEFEDDNHGFLGDENED